MHPAFRAWRSQAPLSNRVRSQRCRTFDTFKLHLHTNTIGPIVLAAQLLKHHPHALRLSNLTFISSDSGSAGKFLSFEDGFAAYGASKAALNQSIRHMAAELGRKGVKDIGVFALHPGEVATDMADVEVEWVVEGVMQPEESVRMCIEVIEARTSEESGTFWTWKDEVSLGVIWYSNRRTDGIVQAISVVASGTRTVQREILKSFIIAFIRALHRPSPALSAFSYVLPPP